MKFQLLILFCCNILKSSFSVPLEDAGSVKLANTNSETNLEKSTSVQDKPTADKSLEPASNVNELYNGENGNYDEVYFPKTSSLGRAGKPSKILRKKTQSSFEKKVAANKKKEYFFLSDKAGNVTIIDQTYNVVTDYELPDLENGNGAIINNIFYNIDILNGQIMSTNIENLIYSENFIYWSTVGAFPREYNFIRSQAAVNESSIYFVTYSGVLYVYNTISKGTRKIGYIEASDSYASLVIVNKILYIHKFNRFYSYNGITLKEIRTSSWRIHCGLFQLGNRVCRLGGNSKDGSSGAVNCYDPRSGKWSVDSTLDEPRLHPAITKGPSGVLVVDGVADPYYYQDNGAGDGDGAGDAGNGGSSSNYQDLWSKTWLFFSSSLDYIPSPITKRLVYPQIISFLY